MGNNFSSYGQLLNGRTLATPLSSTLVTVSVDSVIFYATVQIQIKYNYGKDQLFSSVFQNSFFMTHKITDYMNILYLTSLFD
jgi:hypothetical protein